MERTRIEIYVDPTIGRKENAISFNVAMQIADLDIAIPDFLSHEGRELVHTRLCVLQEALERESRNVEHLAGSMKVRLQRSIKTPKS